MMIDTDFPPCMDPFTPRGARVVFAFPDHGLPRDVETASAYLQLGEVYTIARTEVGGWATKVWLEEVPDVGFNSVQFSSMPHSPGRMDMPKGYDLDELEQVYPNEGFMNLSDAQAQAILRDLRRLEWVRVIVAKEIPSLDRIDAIEAALAGEDEK